MNSKYMTIKVNNVTEGSSDHVVARVVDGECWYYGRYDKSRAEEVAKEIDGIVLLDLEHKVEPVIHTCGRRLTDFDLFMNFCPLCMKSLGERNEQ